MARMVLLCSALMLLAGAGLWAQQEKVRFQHFSVEQGLSQNYVYGILQDSRGYMWFGTRDGLNKYDGYTFTHYKSQPFTRDPGSIPANVIRSVSEDRGGNLWIGTVRGGLIRFDREHGTFSSYRRDPKSATSISDDNILSLYIDRSGTLWAGGADGVLNRMTPSLNTPRRDSDELRHSFIRYGATVFHDRAQPSPVIAMEEDRSGNLWIGTTMGLCLYDRRLDRIVPLPEKSLPPRLRGQYVKSMEPDKEGRIMVGTYIGLFLVDPVRMSFTYIDSSHAYDQLAVDSSGTIWSGHERGVSAYNPVTGVRIDYDFGWHRPDEVRGTVVLAICVDRSGGVWIGTDAGISRVDYRSSRFRNATRDSSEFFSVSHLGVRSIIQGRNGEIWMGTAGKGVLTFRGAGVAPRHTLGRLGNLNYVNVLLEDHSGEIWMGTRAGLATLRNGAIIFHPYPRPLHDSLQTNVWGLCEDRFGILWIGTTSAVIRYDRRSGDVRVLRHDPKDPGSMAYNGAWTILEDSRGELWFGTPGGVDRLDRKSGTFKHYPHDPNDPTSLSHNEVWTIFEDRRGRLWVGTWGGGLSLLDRATGRFTNYTEAKGLGNNTVHGIAEDKLGNLWISHGAGISRFDPATETFTNYGLADGLRFNEYNPNACCGTSDGMMLFGGLYGVTGFAPERVGAMSVYSPPIVITSFKKLDKVYATELLDGAEVEIAHNENYCSFEFAALDYGIPERNRYAYRLEGFDRDWVYSGTRRYVSYTNLDPGNYIFRVKGTNSDGIWNEEGIAIRVRVIPPFWERWIFQVFVGLGLAAIVLVWYRQRVRRRRELEIALDEAREIERRGIAAELHDGPLQDLYSVRFVLEPLAGSVGNGEAGAQVARIDETLRRVRGSLRSVCGDLQLPSFDCGLDAAIDVHAERIRESVPRLDLRLDLAEDDDRIPHDIRRNLFRIYRSALSNVIKHADATEAVVHLAIDGRHLLLEVRDNGRGFIPPRNLNELLRGHHYGLLLIDAHARGIGGRPEILSEPGKGTTIRVRIELQGKQQGRRGKGLRALLHHSNGTNGTEKKQG